jgi:hypothetical protein
VNSTCSNTPINCLNNLECGTNGLSGSLFCQDKDVVQNFLTFTCNNAGTVLSTCSNETTIQINKTCADACNNGACVAITCYNDSQCDDDNVKTIDQCLNPGTGASSCVHMPINCSLNSDCGTDGYLDLFCQSNNVFQNFLTFTCNNPGTANATCSSATNALLNRTCTYGCLNGACLPECTIDSDCLLNQICSNQQCVNVTCKNDSQCDDANPSTTDKCMNPGTVQSYCNNTFVKCNSNSECGTDGISGNAFCLGNSSYQNFLAYKCNNPGSGSSSCTTTTTPMLKQTCSLFCSNGDCVGCFSDENCGTDTFVGDKYCKSKDVYQDFEEFSCNSAGQVNSQCSSNTIPKLIKSCADSCYKGECKNVECTNTDDCDDNNAYTIDECNNPGTTSSYCTSTPVNCLSNNDCGITGFNGQEFCIGADVFKNYQESNCRNPGTRLSYCDISIAQQFIVGCGTGKTCSSGICMPVTCNSNSECGINRFLNQLSCSNNKIYDKFVTFTCNNPGTSISSCSSSNTDVVKQNCQYGCLGEACLPQCTQNSDCQAGQACLNNQCISIVCLGDSDCNDNNPKTADACINPGTIQSSCTHTPISCNSNAECGQNGFVDGLFCQSNNVFQNFMTYTCNNAGTIQSSCSGSVNALIKQTCTFGCSNGICNNNPCIDQDSDGYDTCSPGNPGDDGKQLDCNDNNFNVHPNAVEVCNLIDDNCNGQVDEGTNICGSNQLCVQGQCQNVICNSNAQCGTDGYLNQLFCKNGNVFDKYKTYTCNNAGTAQSSCSNSNSEVLKQTCTQNQVCSGGVCENLNIPCSSDSGCDDANAYTYDKCNNPGTVQSSCIHTPIVCLNNLDCGQNGFINGLFCQSNDVVQNFLTFTCNNPGTIQSSCSSMVTPQLNKTCPLGQSCNNGECKNVACSSNSDCGTDGYLNQLFCKNNNSFDKYKTYTCSNPGTVQSSCSNSNSDVLKQTCSFGCTSGQCSNNPCIDQDTDTYDICSPGSPGDDGKPIDCNDNNPNINPGKSEVCNLMDDNCNGQTDEGGVCVCSKDSDCGTNGFLNQLFCKNGNIFDKYKTYTCNNAGTTSNSCSDAITDKLKQTCEGSSSSVSDSGTITFNSANAPLYLPPSISDPNYKCNNDGITAWTQSNGIYPVLVSSSSSGYTSGSKLSITVPTGQICMRVATPNSNGWCKECGCRNVPNYCSDIQAPSANGLREYTDSNLKIGFYSSNVASTTNLPIAEYQLSQFVGEGMAIPAGTKYIFVYYKEEATGYFDNNVAYNMNFNFNVIESNVNPEVCNICKPIVCSKNSDCNDNNALTTDKCNNPGTTSSSCSYTPVCTSTSSQNPNYPSPYQCGGADWNIGLPRGVTCTGSVTTIGALEEDSKATQVTGNTNRLRPDLTTMNKFCQGYTGQASSYATYGRMHNYCNGCDQRLAWFENNQWTSQAVCYGVLNVQLVTCGTGCTVSPGC